MIRFARPSIPAAVAVLAIAALLGAGCAEPPPPAPQKPAAQVQPAAPVAKPAAAVASAPASVAPASVAPAPAADAIGELVKRLAAASGGDERVAVIDEIGSIGQNALPALDGLMAACHDEDPRVRWHAVRAIGLIGEDARATLPRLLPFLTDADPLVVTQAAAAIARIRTDDNRPAVPEADAAAYAAAIEPLANTAVHPDPRARRAAVRALRTLTPSVETLAPIVSRHLADADPAVVIGAVQTFADMGDDAVPFLVEAMKDPASRYWAEVALAELGPDAAPATAVLTETVESGDVEQRLQAMLTLAAIGEGAAAAGPAIATVLDSGDASLQLAAAFALGRLKAAGADESLAKAAAGGEPFLASVAAWALARIHPDDPALVEQALGRLRQGLASTDPEARQAAVTGLSSLAEGMNSADREELAGSLVPLLADPDRDVGRAAGAALIRIGGDAVAALRAKVADPAVRLQIMEVASALGPAAKPVAGDLVAALGETSDEVRGEAAVALAAIGAGAADGVPGLSAILADDAAAAGLRYAAAYALGRIGPAAAAAEPALRKLSESDDEMMATVAVWAALQVKPGDASLFETAIPRLRRALRADRELARLEAAVALGDIGPAAASAIPILELVSEDDPVKRVRDAAAEALGKIKVK